QFDVVIVPFPFVDRHAHKPRPALVLSTSNFNKANGHTILAMITTASQSFWPSDIDIGDIEAAGLPKPSIIRFKTFTLENDIIAKRIGRLSKADKAKVCKLLSQACPVT
ncbi:MAG TPA: type II toxin-antitoxin system PemK/MazF family toxin, partial [Rhizobiales bacterium]|nr:type II toxin-antitoxin system PemK/MazF family toxin [Hyphomicrobiales bacterium]